MLGGPGDSGVNFILDNAEQLFPLYGKNFNFVSFDPRGVNNSRAGLSLECFPGNAQARQAWNGEYFRKPVDTSSSTSMYEGWARAGGWGALCTTVGEDDSKRRYANTVAAAHDMLHYVELLAQSRGQAAAEAKIWYYGLSYGTALGATFATLFPDRIARMVLDGVVNSDQYYGGRWEDLLTDGDAAVQDFFASCYEAGPEMCVFCGNASSPADVEARFFRIYSDLEENPIIISDPSISSIPTILGAGDLKAALFLATYSPFGDFPLMAAMLAELEVGNATILASRSGLPSRQSPVEPQDDTYVADSVRTQILCLDANGRANISTQEQFEEHAGLLHDLSFFGGEYFSVIMGVACRSYGIRPPPSQVFDSTS
jgi:pimeloyl-ACP methyl ester carboxylesterase